MSITSLEPKSRPEPLAHADTYCLSGPASGEERRNPEVFCHNKDTCLIPLSRGKYALVDWQDYGRVSAHKWSLHNTKSGKAYAVCYIGKAYIHLHRFILEAKPGDPFVDHRNRNGLDCRRNNLRFANFSQNSINKAAYGKSGLKGVRLIMPAQRWSAQIRKDGKRLYLGRYATKEQAARAYDAAAVLLHGEFAVLNFPEDFHEPTPTQPQTTATAGCA